MAPLTAVSPLNRDTAGATRKQIRHKRKFKTCLEERATSKAGAEVPLELITTGSGGEG